jgi:hypothetical protein
MEKENTLNKPKKQTEEAKKLIAILLISQIVIAFFIKIVNLRLFTIIGSLLGMIILITLLYKIITTKQE